MTAHGVERYWSEFLASHPEIDPLTPYQSWYFGNSSEMAPELAGLVLSGKKTATASLKSINEILPENAPIDNGYSVVTSFEGEPFCIIRTSEIRFLPFREVDEDFAFDEGEGDRTLEHWRAEHWKYFEREAAEYGVEFDETSEVCCERFRLIYPK
jgi:uncharacterized protein YhfF